MKETYLCTRMTLASELMEAGHEGTIVQNPFDARYYAWKFEIDEDLKRIVAEYYTRIGKPVPRIGGAHE